MPGKAEKTLPPIRGSGVREDRAPGQAKLLEQVVMEEAWVP